MPTIRSFKQKENAPALRPGLIDGGSAIGGWGAGPDPPSVLMFCIAKCQINASPLCAVPIHSRFFWSAVPAWARFREMRQAERSGGVNELPIPQLGGYRVMTTCDRLWIGRGVGTSVSGRKSPSRLWLTGAKSLDRICKRRLLEQPGSRLPNQSECSAGVKRKPRPPQEKSAHDLLNCVLDDNDLFLFRRAGNDRASNQLGVEIRPINRGGSMFIGHCSQQAPLPHQLGPRLIAPVC